MLKMDVRGVLIIGRALGLNRAAGRTGRTGSRGGPYGTLQRQQAVGAAQQVYVCCTARLNRRTVHC